MRAHLGKFFRVHALICQFVHAVAAFLRQSYIRSMIVEVRSQRRCRIDMYKHM